jgi:hypothetical protein
MSDIVKVLRGKYALDYNEKTLDQFCNEAADEIEKLRAALTEVMVWINEWEPAFIRDVEWMETKRMVRAALGEKQ